VIMAENKAKAIDKSKLLFSFDDLSNKDKALQKSIKEFEKHHKKVVDVKVDPVIKTGASDGETKYKYREIVLFFSDTQQVMLRIVPSGRVYQVLTNASGIEKPHFTVLPIKNQDDQLKAVIEICDKLDADAKKVAAKLSKVKVEPPKSIKTSAVNMMKFFESEKQRITESIAAVDVEIENVKKELSLTTVGVSGAVAESKIITPDMSVNLDVIPNKPVQNLPKEQAYIDKKINESLDIAKKNNLPELAV
jgi:hypothetical protein